MKETLVRRLSETIQKSLPGIAEGLNRFEVELSDLSPLDWLKSQNTPSKIYFSERDNSLQVAAVGAVKKITPQNTPGLKDALEIIQTDLQSSDPGIKYYGGICFDYDDQRSDIWYEFGKYFFLVPQFEIAVDTGKTIFAYNTVTGRQEPAKIIEDMTESISSIIFEETDSASTEKITVTNQSDLPDENRWTENVTSVIRDMSERDIQKVVLARQSQLQISNPLDPVEILSRLKRKNVKTYDFCFQTEHLNAFIGCSPECLFLLNGRQIYSEAIAGTRPKGTDADEQKKYRTELVESEKEQLEHDYVFDDVNESLTEICENVEVPDRRQVVSLTDLQHFCSRFNGRLKDDISICDIIRSLHPTAAVNGYPSAAAIRQIRKYEPFSRGWFAGPVGWIGKDAANFAVAIRSALVRSKQISLFAGAGIVKSSEPAMEWQETQNKIKQFLDVIK